MQTILENHGHVFFPVIFSSQKRKTSENKRSRHLRGEKKIQNICEKCCALCPLCFKIEIIVSQYSSYFIWKRNIRCLWKAARSTKMYFYEGHSYLTLTSISCEHNYSYPGIKYFPIEDHLFQDCNIDNKKNTFVERELSVKHILFEKGLNNSWNINFSTYAGRWHHCQPQNCQHVYISCRLHNTSDVIRASRSRFSFRMIENFQTIGLPVVIWRQYRSDWKSHSKLLSLTQIHKELCSTSS